MKFKLSKMLKGPTLLEFSLHGRAFVDPIERSMDSSTSEHFPKSPSQQTVKVCPLLACFGVQVPMIQKVQKTVEVPQVQYEDQIVHVPVQKQAGQVEQHSFAGL